MPALRESSLSRGRKSRPLHKPAHALGTSLFVVALLLKILQVQGGRQPSKEMARA